VVDLILFQTGSFGESPKIQGVLISNMGGSAIIKTRRGVRRFDIATGYEKGSQALRGGMKIVDVNQLKAQPVSE
jgi:hypothetical protein